MNTNATATTANATATTTANATPEPRPYNTTYDVVSVPPQFEINTMNKYYVNTWIQTAILNPGPQGDAARDMLMAIYWEYYKAREILWGQVGLLALCNLTPTQFNYGYQCGLDQLSSLNHELNALYVAVRPLVPDSMKP